MLSSALIGCFTVRLNVELCSDWLFHSAAQCWALLWLAVSQCGSMLSSALIGCFTVRLNVELCSDWLFHITAHFSSSHSTNETHKIYKSVLSHAVISLGNYTVNNCFRMHDRILLSRSHKLFILFILWSGSIYHTFHKIRCLSVVLRICKSSSVISLYSVYVISEIFCTVTDYR